MEDAKKRWSVTYTKHVKQKRKVYQDGLLDLYVCTGMVKLYDEYEKLLECRILNQEEVVSSGETLTFNAYLVDVGDPGGDCAAIPDMNTRDRDKKISERPNLQHIRKLRSYSISSGYKKIDAEKKKGEPCSPSPSQKFIRKFKKREMHKYGTPQSSPETTNPGMTEWKILYTAQITQKAKKYHDGFLRVSACGSLGRQIKLFDESRKLLDSRFLRGDEVIRSGESTVFDGYLVEIGEYEEAREPLGDLNVQRNNGNIYGKSEEMQGQQNCIKSNKYEGKEFRNTEGPRAPLNSTFTAESNIKEWQIMYTTHVTQKTKKYRDGFLRLSIPGSLQRQVMLYDDCGKLLNSRFLRKDEIIISGGSITFDAHLVDIGEPHGNHQIQMNVNIQGNNPNVVQKAGIMHGHQSSSNSDKSVAKGKPHNKASSREIGDSTCSISAVDRIKLSKGVFTNKPLRDAIQILSILQKPKGQEVSDAVVDVADNGQEPSQNMHTGEPYEDLDFANCPDDIWSSKSISNDPGDDRRISCDELKSPSKMDELPSFNLGF